MLDERRLGVGLEALHLELQLAAERDHACLELRERQRSVMGRIAASQRDKKRFGASVPFVLVNAPGDVRHGAAVDPARLEAAVEALCR